MKKNLKTLYLLHLLLIVFSFSGVISKIASSYAFLSAEFFIWYSLIIILLGIYAIVWQQIIKRMSLTKAYANRAITVVWGMVWGLLFFKESITAGKIAGAVLIIAGIVIFAYSGDSVKNEQ
ncbi:MAG TPA: transporter [Clostridiaceae bacterium]|nr:transporter [Clostridiaceae bacterium]HHX37179.1 transporter [Clostridiaceae bacterium]